MPDLEHTIAGLRCRDLLPLLPDYVESALGAKELAQVNAHLEGCADCAKFGTEYGSLVNQLREHAEPAMNPDIGNRLAERMNSLWASEDE